MDIPKESIFTSSLRAFCKTVAVMIGVLASGFALFFLLGTSPSQNFLPDKSEMTLLPDAEGNRALLPMSAPVILRLNIEGIIGDREVTSAIIENILLDSREGFLYNNRVKALLLYIDTPGGTVIDADGIYRLLIDYKAKYQIPIYAFINGLCASGGMYVASAADKIYAAPPSVIGSVGVIQGPYFNVSDLMQKYGVASKTLTQGKDKDMLNPFRPWKMGEDQSIVSVMDYFYRQFVDIVTTARPQLNKQKLIEEYGAHVFDGIQAQNNGYIDVANASYQTALSDLVQAAKIGEAQEYQVIFLSPRRSFLSQFTNAFPLLNGKIQHNFSLHPSMNSEMNGKLLYLYQPS